MKYLDVFRMPNPVKITGRTSSITNAFINGIVPCIIPTEEEIKTVLAILEMDLLNICCAYCGDKYTEWDHFRPLIQNKRATGYISEINNLVPSCGKCNQSKGNSYWKTWITGNAKLSPTSRNIKNLENKIQCLEEYEKWSKPIQINFEKIVGKEKWEQHWSNCELLHEQMRESQKLSDEIKKEIQLSLTGIKESVNSDVLFLEEEDIFEPQYHEEISQDKFANKKVGIIAQTIFKALLESGKCDNYIITNLQTENYSKVTFDMNFPILMKIRNDSQIKVKMVDHLGRPRYYSTPLQIKGETFLLTSQWYDRNKSYLISWINKYSVSK